MGLEKILGYVAQAFEEGAEEGYRKGYDDGFEDGVDSEREAFKPGVSDGLRHSSSECGRAMNRFKVNFRIITQARD